MTQDDEWYDRGEGSENFKRAAIRNKRLQKAPNTITVDEWAKELSRHSMDRYNAPRLASRLTEFSQDWLNGVSTLELSKKYRVHMDTVRRRAKMLGLPDHKKEGEWTVENIELLRKLWAENITGTKIAKILCRSYPAVIEKAHALLLSSRNGGTCNAWSKSETETLRQFWNQGLSVARISKKINRTIGAIGHKARMMGLEARDSRATLGILPRIKEFKRDWQNNMSLEKLGKKYNVQRRTLYKYRDRLGLARRKCDNRDTWSDDLVKLKKLHKQGLTCREIAKILKRSLYSVQNHARHYVNV